MASDEFAAVWHAPFPAAIFAPGEDAALQLNPAACALIGDANAQQEFVGQLTRRCGDAAVDHVVTADGLQLRIDSTPADAQGRQVLWLSRVPSAAARTIDQLTLAIRLAGVAIYHYDVASDSVTWDAGATAVLGAQNMAELPTDLASLFAAILPDDVGALKNAREQAMAGASPAATVCRYMHPDGTVRHMLTRRIAEYDANGRPTGILGVAIDISDSARAQLEHERLAERLRLATAAAHIGIWDWDLQSNQQEWDDQMRRIYGVGDTWRHTSLEAWYALLHPRDAEDALDDMLRSARDGSPYESAFRIIRPDGQVRHLISRGTIYRDSAGHPIRLVGVDWDVTERRLAERAANEALDRLQLATNAAGIGIWEHDMRVGTSIWSPQMYALFGVPDQLGANPQSLWRAAVQEEDRAQLVEARSRAIRRREPYQTEYRIRWPDGSLRWLAARGIVQFDEAGQPIRLIGVNWDITEERLTEEAVRAKEAAERASQAKSEFLSRMSHELRTPLNGILGFAQLLASDERRPLLPDQRARLRRIEDAGWHLLALINDLLDLSRIESGSLTLNYSAVGFDAVAEEVISLLGQSAAENNVEVSLIKRAARLAPAHADEVRLRQVLTNLVSNAIKYNREGGSVTLSTSEPATGRVAITVHDTGMGMTAVQREHLFQPFNRLGRESSNAPGTGIGLVIAKGLVEQMGGSISVETKEGVGSTFTVELAAAERRSMPRPTNVTASTVRERDDVTGTVLYIEDNALNAMVVQEYLSYRPHVRYLHAPDGETGLRMLGESDPEVVLIDMNLPDMSGSDVLRRARAAGHAGGRCVVLSANVLPNDVAKARSEGFDDYWTKPVTINDFLRGIDKLLVRNESRPA